MVDVIGYRHFLILALAALFSAGCAARPTGSWPATSPGPTQLAMVTQPPTATPDMSPASPTLSLIPRIEGCVGIEEISPASPFFTAEASIGRLSVDLQVTRIEERSGRRLSVNPPEREMRFDVAGLLLGGHEFLTRPFGYYEGHDTPSAMEFASITLTLDGAPPLELPVRFVPGNENFNQAAVSVPDVSGRGRLSFEFGWTDRCFRLEASGSVRVEVVSRAVTAACEMDEVAYWDHLEALLGDSILVGSMTPAVGSPINEAKYAPYSNPGIDAHIAYGFDPKVPAITASPDSLIRIENQKTRLQLADMVDVHVWTRRSVADAVEDYPPHDLIEVLDLRAAQQPDGSFRFRVPGEPGRYVAAISVRFDSKCSTGTMWSVVNLDVVAP